MIKKVRQCVARRIVERTGEKTFPSLSNARRLKSSAKHYEEHASAVRRCAENLMQIGDKALAERMEKMAKENSQKAERSGKRAEKIEEKALSRRQKARRIARFIAGK